ncbi:MULTISPECIES: hypothetical protein [unclassified Streptomyces]|uniref:hypothetical protein n=1 Tax=unclassified Streptomyces TaxID=2593676 RepID=UPI000DBAB097|nr:MULTISPECIES: hypothetical protein [unclassified Streptomyces]MYT73395.1 hypothetical protein [Streptomyces sp. SID8367]
MPDAEDMYKIGPLIYNQGHVLVWKEKHGVREEALMHDRAIVAVRTGSAYDEDGEQLFRAWVDANELPQVLSQWANVLR